MRDLIHLEPCEIMIVPARNSERAEQGIGVVRLSLGPAERESRLGRNRLFDVPDAVRPYLHGDPAAGLVLDQHRRSLRAVIKRIFLEGIWFAPYHARPPRGHLVSAEYLHMTGLTRNFFMNARGHCLLDFGVAILAGSSALYMTHAALAGLVAIYAFDLFADVNVLGKSRRLGEFFSEITVASSALNGSRVADEGAPAAAGAVRRRG